MGVGEAGRERLDVGLGGTLYGGGAPGVKVETGELEAVGGTVAGGLVEPESCAKAKLKLAVEVGGDAGAAVAEEA